MQLENRPNNASTSSTSAVHKGRGLLIYTKSSSSDAIQSVSFLPDNRFLLVTTRVGDLAKDATLERLGNCPVLAVYDLDQASTSQHEGVSSPIAVFSLELGNESDSGEMALYYRLRVDIHSYSDEVAVPLFRSPSYQLIALKTKG